MGGEGFLEGGWRGDGMVKGKRVCSGEGRGLMP